MDKREESMNTIDDDNGGRGRLSWGWMVMCATVLYVMWML
jgi:hypothetical protein